MRILQVIDSMALGGAEVLLSNLVPAFVKRGIDCHILMLHSAPTPLVAPLEASGIIVNSTGVKKLYSLRQVGALRSLLRQYDMGHIHLFPAQLWAVLGALGRSADIPLVTTEHNTTNARRRWWLRPLDAWMYPRYRAIACNSAATATELVNWCPGAEPLVRVIPNGIPIQHFQNASAADLPSQSERARVVFVGRFEPQKDHATILRALPSVPDAEVIFIGEGPLLPNMQALSKELGVADRVTFLGRRTDVAEILKASDVYVHSTTSDGFGIAACEAMAAGLPVIVSDVPGLAQVVEGAGLLFNVGDHAALAALLNTVLSSAEKRQRMSEASIQRASNFSIEKTADLYLEMYQSILQ